jgi:hypothetical protein
MFTINRSHHIVGPVKAKLWGSKNMEEMNRRTFVKTEAGTLAAPEDPGCHLMARRILRVVKVPMLISKHGT